MTNRKTSIDIRKLVYLAVLTAVVVVLSVVLERILRWSATRKEVAK